MASNVSVEGDAPSDSRDGNTSSNSDNDSLPSLVELHRIKRWLQHQIIQTSAAINEAEDRTVPIADSEIVDERIKELSDALKDVTFDNEIQQLLLERTQLSDTLIKVLFPKEGERPENDLYRQKVVENIETQNQVSSLVMKSHEEHVRLQKEFVALRKERLQVMIQNRELMDQLKTAQSSTDNTDQFSKDQEVERSRNAVDDEHSKAKLIRGIFQMFIVGSGIHWAQDDYLRELMVQLGQPLRRELEEL